VLTAIAENDRRLVAQYFLLRGVAWSLALFGVLRLSWFELHAVLPLTQLQGRLAVSGFGVPALPIDVTLACSGADALALCAGTILAYPARWRTRLGGAAAGVALILALNTIRIGTLGRAAASPYWFETLHVLVWPAALTLAVAAYVFAWMRYANGRQVLPSAIARPASPSRDTDTTGMRGITGRFMLVAAILLILFVAASPLYLESAAVLAVAAAIARIAATMLTAIGIESVAYANVLSTPKGAFLVTQECISTPLIPIYVAAVLAYARSWRAGALLLLAALPLFAALGVARLFVVAVPAALIGSPLFLIHAFYQLLLAAVVVAVAAIWRHGTGARAQLRACLGMALGVVSAWLVAPLYTRAFAAAAAAGLRPDDPQGAIAMLPAFQVGLFVALVVVAFVAVDWRRWAGGLAVLAVSQAAALFVVQLADRYAGLTPHVRDVRAWALAAPLLLIAAMLLFERRRAADDGDRVDSGDVAAEPDQASWYRRFWADVGERFPDLGGAASTEYYAANEQRLFTEHLAPLGGLKILKTDLWDEAKNTRILAWASEQGGHAYGIDISAPTVIQARTAFTNDPLRCAVSDVRTIPFRDASFDAIYSMGTIEHFDETEQAVAEMARVLKPGGRAIIGVPNRHDPFLRPLLAAGLQAMGWYAYGLEKSYSRRALREMLERAGLTVVAETAILFIPGWLRMLDLVCHSWCRPLAPVTRACVWPFVMLDRYVPAVRPHGYMLATVVTKPIRAVNAGPTASSSPRH